MPETTPTPRIRKVRTITETEENDNEKKTRGLEMPWQEYLATLSAEDLAIHDIYIYRKEPVPISGYLAKVHECIDDQWLSDRFGGGTYDLVIRSLGLGISAWERGVKIVGEPKLTDKEKPASNPVQVLPSSGADASNQRLVDLLEKTIERLSNLQQPTPTTPNPAQDSVLEVMSAAAKRGIEIAGGGGANTPAANPLMDKVLMMVLERGLNPPAPETFEQQLTKLKTLRDIIAPSVPGSTGSLAEQLEGISKIGEMMGWKGGGGGGGKWYEDVLRTLAEKAPEIFEKIREVSQDRVQVEHARLRRTEVAAAAAAQGAGGRQPVLPSTQTPAPSSAAVPVQAGPGGIRMAGMNGGTPGTQSAAPPTGAIDTESEAFQLHMKQAIVRIFNEGGDGGFIVDFLMANNQGRFVEMLGRFSTEQISSYFKADPVLSLIASDEEWPAVLAEAQEYIQERQRKAAQQIQ